MIGLYIAYTIPVYLRWRKGDSFVTGPWTLGKKYKWINPIAVVWVAICVVIFCLPFTPEGVPWRKAFSWSAVNYAPIVTIGTILAVTIWYAVSAKKTFKGPIRTIDELDSRNRAARHLRGAVAGRRAWLRAPSAQRRRRGTRAAR